MNNTTRNPAALTTTNAWPEPHTREDMLKIPAWIVQYNTTSATLLREEWDAITDEEFEEEGLEETPDIARHLDEIRPGDFILFWVSGPGNTAGIYAWGNASGEVTECDYPKRWSDPDGPRVRKTGMQVEIGDVFPQPFATRNDLKQFREFDNFELFKMPNRPNAFAVTPGQWAIILDRLTRTD